MNLRRRVISKVCVLWFVTLIVLPFTAPFATCDLSTADHHFDALAKDKTGSDEKLLLPSWAFMSRTVRAVPVESAAGPQRIASPPLHRTVLRL